MPDSTPKSRLDLEDLALHEGATVLLRSALSHLAAGDWCEVRGDSAEFASQIAATLPEFIEDRADPCL